MARLRKFLLNLTHAAAFIGYGLLIGLIIFTDSSHGGEMEKLKATFDFNFWLALVAATGVPAFAWWMVRSGMGSIKESLANLITVELCTTNRAVCQRSMLESLSQKFASKDIEECIEDLREKREVTHARIYDEIKTNRENVNEQLNALRTDISQMIEKAHESYKLEIEYAILRDRERRSQ